MKAMPSKITESSDCKPHNTSQEPLFTPIMFFKIKQGSPKRKPHLKEALAHARRELRSVEFG